MAFFDKWKKALTTGKKQGEADNPISSPGMDASDDPSFHERRTVLADHERQERVDRLTPREYDLYLLLLEGYTLKESAKRLSIQYSTANTHMTGIYRKLGVKSRAELIIHYRYITSSTDANGQDS